MSEAANMPARAQGHEVAVKKDEGEVLLAIFNKEDGRINWARLKPEVALHIGQQLARDSYEILYNQPPPRSALRDAEIEVKRRTLMQRLPTIMRQLREKKRSDPYIIEKLLDHTLQELFL